MLIPNNPNIDFDDLNARISQRLGDAPVVPQPLPLHALLALEDTAFIEQAYANYLARLPEPGETMQMQSALHQGTDKYSLILQLLKSGEFSQRGVPLTSRRLKLHLLLDRIPLARRLVQTVLGVVRLPHLHNQIRAQQSLLSRQQQEYLGAIAELQEESQALREALIAQTRASEQMIADSQVSWQASWDAANRRIKALQLALSTSENVHKSTTDTPAVAQNDIDPSFYLAFEDRFRGTPELIRERLSVYLPTLRENHLLQQADHRIIDLGCGRGEWLKLLREQGYNALGLDLSPVNTALCQEQSLDVLTGDAIAWLGAQPDNSISCITGFHIIEHLEFPVLRRLFEQAARALKPGGLLIFETPNAENLVTGATHFHTDPTHRHPLPPALTEFVADYYGFTNIEIRRLHPIPADYQIHEDSETARRCNQYFYSAQDYALVATCPMPHEDQD